MECACDPGQCVYFAYRWDGRGGHTATHSHTIEKKQQSAIGKPNTRYAKFLSNKFLSDMKPNPQ